MKHRLVPPSRRNRRRNVWAAAVIALAAGGLFLAGCGPGGAAGTPGSGAQAPGEEPAPASTAVRLVTDRQRYAPAEPMRLTVRNEGQEEIQLSGGLGGLRGWRLQGGAREPWAHGLMETAALVPVAPGASAELGPVPAPERPGRYLLQVTYFTGSGQGKAEATIEVTGR
ncbi:MAG TPA: hypothetical protein VIK92_05230 [Thermaerobacter sp.]